MYTHYRIISRHDKIGVWYIWMLFFIDVFFELWIYIAVCTFGVINHFRVRVQINHIVYVVLYIHQINQVMYQERFFFVLCKYDFIVTHFVATITIMLPLCAADQTWVYFTLYHSIQNALYIAQSVHKSMFNSIAIEPAIESFDTRQIHLYRICKIQSDIPRRIARMP